ncbi:hypothetical protein [Hydrocarboniphaga effusa]|uniref:hypothetical protein n=1 Tax=Hydrocarboniphaga effusa TaxID=243629 RepID=UPI003137C8BB
MSEGLRKKGSTKKPDKPGKSPATLRSLRKRLKGLLYIQGVTGGDEWNPIHHEKRLFIGIF